MSMWTNSVVTSMRSNVVRHPRKPSKKKMWYKDGTATMLFCENITEDQGLSIICAIQNACKKEGTHVKGLFLFTK